MKYRINERNCRHLYTVQTGCGFDPHFFALVSRTSAVDLSPATQHSELGRKWGTECLNTMSAYPAVCGIQREAIYTKQYIYIYIYECNLCTVITHDLGLF